jgi:hypothetical protein
VSHLPTKIGHGKRLSHEKRRERRLRMAIAVCFGSRPAEVAKRYRVSLSSVSAACQAHGVRWPRAVYRTRIDYSGVDWTMRDATIAAALGCTRANIGRKRRSLGLPPNPRPRSEPQRLGELSRWVIANAEFAAILPAARIAKAFGAAIGSVDGARKLAGTPAGAPWIRGFPAGGMNWELPDLDLARIWGSDSRRVGAMRRRHGAGPSRWIERDERNASDAAYRKAVAREREAAMDRRRLLAMANRALDQAEQDKSKERRGRPRRLMAVGDAEEIAPRTSGYGPSPPTAY